MRTPRLSRQPGDKDPYYWENSIGLVIGTEKTDPESTDQCGSYYIIMMYDSVFRFVAETLELISENRG